MTNKVTIEDMLLGVTLTHHDASQPPNNISKYVNGQIININDETEYASPAAQRLGEAFSKLANGFRPMSQEELVALAEKGNK